MGRKIAKSLGLGAWLAFVLAVVLLGQLVSAGLNAAFRPGYHVRDLKAEYLARLLLNRTYWYDYKAFRLECANGDERRLVLLDRAEFEETARGFLDRRFPECRSTREKDFLPPGISRCLVERC